MPVIGIKNIQDRLELNDLLYLSGLSSSDVEKARVSANWTVIVGSNGNRNRIGNAQLIRNDAGFLPRDGLELELLIMRELGFGGCLAVIEGGYRPGSSTSEDGVGALSAFSFLYAMKRDAPLPLARSV